MISCSDAWGGVALDGVAIPATSVAKGWASLMSSYDLPGDAAADSQSGAHDDPGSVPSQGPDREMA